MVKSVIRVKLDVIFKMLFSENLDLLHELLSGLLELPKESIKNIVIKNSEILPDGLYGKLVRMDLNMDVDGKLINVEMQYGKDYNFRERILFHWSKLYSGELKSGFDFSELKPTICIGIVDFNMFDCEAFHSDFTVMERSRHEVLTEKCGVHIFELPKISKKVNKDNLMELWLQLINAETEEELEMLEQTGVMPIQKAVYVLHKMSEDEKIQEAARLRERALLLESEMRRVERREGLEDGLREGMESERKKWQGIVADIIADKDAQIAELQAKLRGLS